MKSTFTFLLVFCSFSIISFCQPTPPAFLQEEYQPMQPCSTATVVSCGTVLYNHTTFGAGNHFTISDYIDCYSSASSFNGPDRVYELNIAERKNVRFVLNILSNADLDLFLLSDCYDPNNASAPQTIPTYCIGKSVEDNSGTGIYKEILDIILDPGTYYLIVDGYNSNQQGNYDLEISCECDCTEEQTGHTPNARSILCENFQKYNLNSVDPQSTRWRRWNVCAPDGSIWVENNGNRYLRIEDTGTQPDLLYLLDNRTEGRFRLSWDMWIEEDYGGYYNIQHGLQDSLNCNSSSGANWAFEVYFHPNGSGELLVYGSLGDPDATFNFNTGQWTNVMQIIDIDADIAELWIDHNFVYSWPFSVGSPSSSSELSAINFFANELNNYRVNDICLWEEKGFVCTTIVDPVCIDNGQQYPNECKAKRDGMYIPAEFQTCYGVCDQGGPLTYFGDIFPGTLDGDDLAPPLLLSEPCILDAYGGSINFPLYADIQVFYLDESDGDLDPNFFSDDPQTRLFVFSCDDCNLGSCQQVCLGEVGVDFCLNGCSDPGFYYFVILSPVNDNYSLQVFPSGACDFILQQTVPCGDTISGTLAGYDNLFNVDNTYSSCYNGFREYNGFESAYRIDIQDPSFVSLSLDPVDAKMGMFVFDYLCGKNCIAYTETPDNTQPAMLDSLFLDEGTYYIVIDKDGAGSDNFDLSVNCGVDPNFVFNIFGFDADEICPVDNNSIHSIGIDATAFGFNPDYLISFFTEVSFGAKKLIEGQSQFWNGLNPMVFEIPEDDLINGLKCSYYETEPFIIGIFDTGEGTLNGGLCEIGYEGDDNVTFESGGMNIVDNLDFEVTPVNFSLSTSYLSVQAAGAVKTIQVVTSNISWHVQLDNSIDWIHFSSSTGLTQPVNITIDPNPDCEPRSALVEFLFDTDPPIYRQLFIDQFGECVVPPVTLEPSGNITVCEGTSLTVSANISGGCPGTSYTYKWNTGATTSSINVQPLSSTPYSVTVTSKNCIASSTASVNVTTTPPPAAPTYSGPADFCETQAVSLTVVPAPGTTARWYTQASGGTPIFTGNTYTPDPAPPPGTHTWYAESWVSGSDCVSMREEVSITVHEQPAAAIGSPTALNCNITSVTLDASNSTPASAMFAWTGPGITAGGNTAMPTVNEPGMYTVTVTTFGSCQDTESVTVNEIQPPTAAAAVQSHVLCKGDNTGSAIASAVWGSPGYTFEWSNGTTGSEADNLAAGIYTVTATDMDMCTSTASVTITEPAAALAITFVSQINIDCMNPWGSGTVSTSGGTGAHQVEWNTGEIGSTAFPLAAGLYSATVTDQNGCTDELEPSISIIEIPPPTITQEVLNHVSCYGGNDGAALVDVAPGSPPLSVSWPDGTSDLFSTSLTAGSHTVTVTDAIDCEATTTIVITQPSPIEVTASSTDLTAVGSNDGTACVDEITGGTPPYTYSWSNEAGDIISGEMCIENLVPGLYTVVITDDNGCTESETVTINDITCVGISLNISLEHVSCHGAADGSASASTNGGTAPFIYEWSNGQTGDQIMNLPADEYMVTLTDAFGCKENLTFEITEPDLLLINISSQADVDCFGNNTGTATVGASGGVPGYSYQWSNGQSGPTATGLQADMYEVTATDDNGCTTSISVSIEQPDELTVSTSGTDIMGGVGANDGTASANPAGGIPPYAYEWSNGATTPDISGLPPDTYSVTVTDANGCEVIETVVVLPFDCSGVGVDIIITGNILCFGEASGSATASPTGGEGPFEYEWSNGATTIAVSDLVADNYTVTMTDNNGCEVTASIMLDEPPAIDLTAVVITNDEGMTGIGSIEVEINGGTPPYLYAWTNSAGTYSSDDEDIHDLFAGNYTLTVTDGNGCEQVFENIFVDNITAASSGNITERDIRVFPNPTTGKIYVQVTEPLVEPVDISVYDILGHTVLIDHIPVTGQPIKLLDLSTNMAGIYLMKFTAGDQVMVKRVVLQY